MTQKPDAVETLTTDETVKLIALLPDGELRYIDNISKVNDFTNGFTEMPSPRITTAALKALTAERDALLREVEAGKSFIGGIYKLLDDHGDCERGCMTCIAMRRIRETYSAALEGESR